MKPHTLIIRAAGTNCDQELAAAFELAGADTRTIHLNALIQHPEILDQTHIIGLPGGFSYGDDIAAGRIFSRRLRHRLLHPLLAAVNRGVPIIGICNGFQVLTQVGLLPDPESAINPDKPQSVALADNDHGRFIDTWVPLVVHSDSPCIWTRGLDRLELPVAHGEGRFVVGSSQQLNLLRDQHQVALKYNTAAGVPSPNGSADDIAGICDPSGLILGLMPHPERAIHPTHHPDWPRIALQTSGRPPLGSGLQLFRNAVEHVRNSLGCRLATR